jgi:alkanesulfonate monooxygenase SsuD/methylene tetrahydromethanopterin reductase-like flavin-dependent oxidoreductase (luciferase family)
MASMAADRQPRGTAFALRDAFAWPVFAGLARTGEALGYRAVFLPEIAGRDAFAALNGLAGETGELLLGTGIVPMTSRVARATAMGAATVHERSGGRAVLGVGTGPARAGALRALEAQVAELRALLRPDGGLSLRLPSSVPIWVSALGPEAVALAGRIADGVLLNWCTPARVAEARGAIRAAAETAGRDPDAITIAAYVRGSLGGDPEARLTALRAAAGEYASYPAYARQFGAMGLGDEAAAAGAAHLAGAPQAVPEALVRAVCLPGDPGEARARLETYRDAGADLPVVYPVPAGDDAVGSVEATLRAAAPSA